MARNQPNDFSDDDSGYTSHSSSSGSSYSSSSSSDAPGSLGANGLTSADMDLTGMGERMTGDISVEPGLSPSSQPSTPSPAQEAASAAQKTATKSTATARSGSERHDSPTSMAKKRRNQPG